MDFENLIKNLKSRNFDVYFANDKKEALNTALSLIPKKDIIAWGGSKTLQDIGLIDKLRDEDYNLLDRDAVSDMAEKNNIMRKALLSDTYLMSSNAISQDGILVNIDGNGNRVAAMCYGPKSVIMIIGKNKICDTVENAEKRVHDVAAVKNAERFGLTKTGCSKGKCCDCLSDECMCSYVVKTRRNKIPHRIKIIIVNEELGF